ncbi:hypothetical protein [Fodinicola acaciae]|uniref:hypothetical protein n=1 Tax=Fodinicola acaciae TaxID=2681555 RepID=UPI0013CF6495|nr:hypothetical protein [Fodinicola acaciae]
MPTTPISSLPTTPQPSTTPAPSSPSRDPYSGWYVLAAVAGTITTVVLLAVGFFLVIRLLPYLALGAYLPWIGFPRFPGFSYIR